MEHFAPLQLAHVHLVGGQVAVGAPHKAEGALPGGGDGDYCQGGGSLVGAQAGHVHLVFLQHAFQIVAESVPSDLS